MSAAEFPGIGSTYLADFGEEGPWGLFATELTFHDSQRLYVVVVRGGLSGTEDTVDYRATPIAEGIWLVSWQETRKITVTQVQDFARQRVVSNITIPDKAVTFVQLTGSLIRRDPAVREGLPHGPSEV